MKTINTPLPGSANSSGPDSSPMATLTPAASLMSSPVTSPAMPSATSSPGSADGALPYSLQDGLPTDLFGPGVAPASLSAAPASSSVPPMNATSGQPSLISSASAALSLSLGSRLQTLLAKVGSMEYRQTWSKKATPAGRPYWAHTASAHRISGNDFTGWPTPNTIDSIERTGMRPSRAATGRTTGYLSEAVVSYASPAGWPSPKAKDGREWSPNCKPESASGHGLGAIAQLAGWATPTTRDHKDGASIGTAPTNCLLGRQVWLLPAQTEKRGALNPAHSRWLMGFPAAWDSCGATAMQSCLRLRRNSSKQRA